MLWWWSGGHLPGMWNAGCSDVIHINQDSVIGKYMKIKDSTQVPDYETDSIYAWVLPYHWPHNAIVVTVQWRTPPRCKNVHKRPASWSSQQEQDSKQDTAVWPWWLAYHKPHYKLNVVMVKWRPPFRVTKLRRKRFSNWDYSNTHARNQVYVLLWNRNIL